MFLKAGRTALLLGAVSQLLILMPYAGVAHAQQNHHHRADWERDRDYRPHEDRYQRERERERERKRKDEAKATGIAVGVVGTAVLAGVIAAAAKREKEKRARADYCINRYGNYDRANDTYRAADGYTYRCQ